MSYDLFPSNLSCLFFPAFISFVHHIFRAFLPGVPSQLWKDEMMGRPLPHSGHYRPISIGTTSSTVTAYFDAKKIKPFWPTTHRDIFLGGNSFLSEVDIVVHLLWSTCLLHLAIRSICVGVVRFYIVEEWKLHRFYYICSFVCFFLNRLGLSLCSARRYQWVLW